MTCYVQCYAVCSHYNNSIIVILLVQIQWTAESCVEQATTCVQRTTCEAGKDIHRPSRSGFSNASSARTTSCMWPSALGQGQQACKVIHGKGMWLYSLLFVTFVLWRNINVSLWATYMSRILSDNGNRETYIPNKQWLAPFSVLNLFINFINILIAVDDVQNFIPYLQNFYS